ncbi:MAG: branched-chain amino acid ABC transporter permease [Burkholderiaceae bacterium]|jgi:branched-chain amino acid transport system permease protein|nr:branched-chain amino acid ABC transporter permease [Burkholderiaceae bacterium]
MSSATGARRCGDFRTGYHQEMTWFPSPRSAAFAVAGLVLLACAPLVFKAYGLALLIQIGYYGIAALGLNLVTGFSGQISLGHAAFFGFGAFFSAWLNNRFGVPVLLAIPLAGLATALVGLVFGTPAARIKGLYLAIATLAAQYILEDFFSRAAWFTGGAAGATAHPPGLAGFEIRGDTSYFYLVLVVGVLMFAFAANLMRTRAGRAMVAVRDHYLAAEIMGIALTRTRVLAFALASFYAGVAGALMGHYIGFVSTESINILLSVQMLGMIIIGGLGSIMGSLLGAAFMVLMPEAMESLFHALGSGGADKGLVYLKEISIGAVIILFLVFEPDGLAHRWRQVKAWWKLYPFSH